MNSKIQEYLDRLHSLSSLSEETRQQLLDYISIRKVNKGDFILKRGEVCRHIYFVDRGIARIFYYKNGRDITEWFASQNEFLFSIKSYFKESPSNLAIEALEDSEIILLSKACQQELIKSNLEVANLMIEAFSFSLILSQERMETIQFETAKERYLNLLKDKPEIIQKAPLQHIASFLGITQETLSRIRSQI